MADLNGDRPDPDATAVAPTRTSAPPEVARWYSDLRPDPPEEPKPREEPPSPPKSTWPQLHPQTPGARPPSFGTPTPRPDPPPLPPSVAPEDLEREGVHGDSLLRRVGRGALRPFRPADDVQALAEHGKWIQHPVTTGRRIAVTGIRGGAGKSTVAALIAAAFARYRQDRVLALDLDPEFGSLPLRLGMRAEHTLSDLAGTDLGTAPFDEVEPRLARLGESLWALPGHRGAIGTGTDADVYRAAGVPLSRFFGITVTDCGAGISTGLHHAVLSAAHAQVLVTPATVEGSAAAGRALDWMNSSGFQPLVAHTLVVFTVHTPHLARLADVKRAGEILAEAGVSTIKLGFDRHIATGSVLDTGRLAYGTRVTAIAIAAEALRRTLNE